jgi:hypothetical protein
LSSAEGSVLSSDTGEVSSSLTAVANEEKKEEKKKGKKRGKKKDPKKRY